MSQNNELERLKAWLASQSGMAFGDALRHQNISKDIYITKWAIACAFVDVEREINRITGVGDNASEHLSEIRDG